MRKYREYSDSELREKFPEVDDLMYPRGTFKNDLDTGTLIVDGSTGNLLTNMREVEELCLISKSNRKEEE